MRTLALKSIAGSKIVMFSNLKCWKGTLWNNQRLDMSKHILSSEQM